MSNGSAKRVTSTGSRIKLHDGQLMPAFGLGVSRIDNGQPAKQAVTWALEAGCRHIDTAWLYRNETSVGTAIKDFPVDRKDVWVTTKIYPNQFTNPRRASPEPPGAILGL